MRNLLFTLAFLSSSFSAAFAQEILVFLTYGNGTSPVAWTSAGWKNGTYNVPIDTPYYPGEVIEPLSLDFTNATVQFPGGYNARDLQINVNENITVGRFIGEYGQFSVNMNMTDQLGTGVDSSITVKATNSATSTYEFINTGTGIKISGDVSEMKFTGGTVNLVGLDAGNSAKITVRVGGNAATGVTPSALTFTSTNVLNSENALILQGINDSTILPINLNASMNLEGTINVRKDNGKGTAETPQYDYFKLSIASCSNSQGIGLTTNISGTTNSFSFQQGGKTIANLSGKMNIIGTNSAGTSDNDAVFVLDSGAIFNVKDKGVVDITAPTQTSNANVLFKAGSTINIEKGGTFNGYGRLGSTYGSGLVTTINIEKGGTFNTGYFRTSAATNMNVYGELKATSGSAFYFAGGTGDLQKSILNVYAGAEMDVSIYQMIYNAEMNVLAGVGKGALTARNGYILMDANGATFNIYASNAFKGSATTSTQKDVYISNTKGTGYVNLYANQDFSYFNFSVKAKDGDAYSKITTNLFLSDDVTRLNLVNLGNNQLVTQAEGNMEHWLVIDNFRNELIHLDAKDTSIDFTYVVSKEGDWENFRFEQDLINGGFWLAADYIPEPSAFAAIFGVLAIGFAAYRRRK